MSRETFHHVLKRYLEGRCTEEEKKTVEQWYGLLDDEELPVVHPEELTSIDERLWNVVQAKMNESVKPVASAPVRKLWPRLAIAASFIGILMMVGYWRSQSGSTPDFFVTNTAANLIKKLNQTELSLEVTLEDGSTVRLQPHASLTYPRQFAISRREVFVQGEAFFQVRKNTARPFYVHSSTLLVQVVGTSFVVRADEKSHQSEVVVLTGKVMVTKNEKQAPFYQKILPKKSAPLLLTPNQRAIYEQDTQELTATLVEDPLPVKSEAKEEQMNFVFNETPLSQVLPELEKVYGIRIIVGNPGVYRCTFTGDLKNQHLYDQLEFICQSIRARYQIKGTTIFIEGGNCK